MLECTQVSAITRVRGVMPRNIRATASSAPKASKIKLIIVSNTDSRTQADAAKLMNVGGKPVIPNRIPSDKQCAIAMRVLLKLQAEGFSSRTSEGVD